MAQAPDQAEELLSTRKAAFLACFWPLIQAACLHDYKAQAACVSPTVCPELGII